MSAHADRRRAAWRPIAAATVGGAVVIATGFGVWASLNATASGAAESISSGTLKLTLAANGTGFSQGITNLAPGDVVNRYVDLTNSGTLDAQALTMQVAAASGSSPQLLTDGTSPATKALRISVNACSTAWSPTAGTCSGTTTQLLASTAAGSLATAASLVAAAVPAGTVEHLQISTQLPDQTETTVNGALPSTTIQGQSATLTYTFAENQRTATTTNS